MDYFQFYDIPLSFKPDQVVVKKKFYELSKTYHPDFYISESEENGIWTLQANIFEQNKASIRLHEKAGFRKVGYREKIGKIGDQWFNITFFEKRSKNII